MGNANCNCKKSTKNMPETIIETASISDSPVSITYKVYENIMIPEIKEIYQSFFAQKSKNIKKIEIIDKDLGEIGADLISKILQELPNLRELILINNRIGPRGMKKLSDTTSSLINLEKLTIKKKK